MRYRAFEGIESAFSLLYVRGFEIGAAKLRVQAKELHTKPSRLNSSFTFIEKKQARATIFVRP